MAALSSPDTVVRESASARLVVIGQPAVPLLEALVANRDSPAEARSRALGVLDSLDRRRAVEAAASCVPGGDERLAFDAIQLLEGALFDPLDAGSGDLALDHLTRLVLTPAIPTGRRQTMIDILRQLPARLRHPVLVALSRDRDPVIAEHARRQEDAPRHALERWGDDERLPHTPDVLEDALAVEADQVAITALHRLLALIRRREAACAGVERDGWGRVRGLLHELLARRGSAIALYDLRETLEDARQPASTHILAAAQALADASCLEAVASRWVHAGEDIWLRDQLERIFHAIVSRERLRRQSAPLTKLLRRHPAAGPLVAMAPRRRPGAS